MNFKIKAKGHANILSEHKSTFEITSDPNLSLSGDCIIGVSMNYTLNDLPSELKEKINDRTSIITVRLSTENGEDEIRGYGHPDLTLDHLTDIVCRKSSYICSRTLMINSNKAASDLSIDLISDLRKGKILNFEIILK
jgi:uncharacterized protein